MSHVIIGTAGHIDHGKTALIKALTGIDTDTLPQEKDRGVTIDIGFAYWKDQVTIIDVPGHERFVKNMVTGVCSVDLALFVVAADDGAMPQTREHLGILNFLGVRRGVVALNKVDLVEPDWAELVEEDLRDLFSGTFLDGAPIVPVSAATGEGIETLRTLLEEEIGKVETRPDGGVFRLPVDRVFSVRGFGTVVTGTVLSGEVRVKDVVMLQPVDQAVRVRGVQVHGRDVETALVGHRAAINLADVEVDQVARGDLLAQQGYFSSTYMLDARLRLLKDAPASLKNRARVHLHLGPRDVLARVVLLEADELHPGESQLVQFRLEGRGVAARGDRFVIRRYSPVQTLGGGVVLDAQPVKHRRYREDTLERLRGSEVEDPTQVLGLRLRAAGFRAVPARDLAAALGLSLSETDDRLQDLLDDREAFGFRHAGEAVYVHMDSWQSLLTRITEALSTYHKANPLKAGVSHNELRPLVEGKPNAGLFEHAIDHLLLEKVLASVGPLLRLAEHRIRFSGDQGRIREEILDLLRAARAAPPDLNEIGVHLAKDTAEVHAVAAAMQAMGEIVRFDENLVFLPRTLEEIEQGLVSFLQRNREMSVSAFRDLVGTTRKYAVPLLNYFDNKGVTMRKGDVRVLAG
ncbi:MAG: selenocysteine-specific translation elongation factor [Gemmatimonadetes bacterium]|nr:selenocysteine-specific translation elongation factor [Gemmatimonadota bacterium]